MSETPLIPPPREFLGPFLSMGARVIGFRPHKTPVRTEGHRWSRFKSEVTLRVVFDCLVFLQAASQRESIAAPCLRLAEGKHIELCLSPAVLTEVGDVLSRPSIRSRFATLNDSLVTEFLRALTRFGKMYPLVREHVTCERDPKDEPYLNLAIGAEARFLASRDFR